MDKHEIITRLSEGHAAFIQYINDLTDEEYIYVPDQKWTARQQLEHIVLCVKPLAVVFGLDREVIEQKFGISGKPSRSYEAIQDEYKEKLRQGGKAPERFVPAGGDIRPDPKNDMTQALTKLINELCTGINNFSEADLDGFLLKHPLLGELTMREMLYNAIGHVQHHHELTKQNLMATRH